MAKKLFLNKGFSNVSTDSIAKSAKIAKGTIFHHFASKDDLAIAVVNHFLKEALEKLALMRRSHTARETMQALIKESLRVEAQAPGLLGTMLEIILRFTDEQVTRLTEEGFLPYLEFIANLFTDLNLSNPWVKAQILIALIDGIGIQLLLFERTDKKTLDAYSETVDFSSLADHIIELILNQKSE
ncbi:MAG: TetR/AcrR family transcriptional regulator [Candidatus Hodarchaeota archaeon]